jgi:hypothetical protein
LSPFIDRQLSANADSARARISELSKGTSFNRIFILIPLMHSRIDTARLANAKFEPGFQPEGLSMVPQRASSA